MGVIIEASGRLGDTDGLFREEDPLLRIIGCLLLDYQLNT